MQLKKKISKYYSYRDILNCWRYLKIDKGDTVYITGDLSCFGRYKNLKNILSDFSKSLKKVLGKSGTIVFPTHSWSVLKRNKIFSLEQTKSESGVLSEYLRKDKKSFRQPHPFSSISAIGKMGKFITCSSSKHVYGPDTPFEKLILLNAKFISLGLEPNFTCSQVHHIEFINHVPYRFTKEFLVKTLEKKKIILKKYYLFVLYKSITESFRDRNRKICKNFKKKNKILEYKLGKSKVYCYSIKDFSYETSKLMKKDIYCWLKKLPKKKKLGIDL